MSEVSGISRRGFASMSPERHKEIAARGGRSVKAESRTFYRDRELAARAGRKGGLASGGRNRLVICDTGLVDKVSGDA